MDTIQRLRAMSKDSIGDMVADEIESLRAQIKELSYQLNTERGAAYQVLIEERDELKAENERLNDALKLATTIAREEIAVNDNLNRQNAELFVNAERYLWLRNESWAGYSSGKGFPVVITQDAAMNKKVQLAEDAMDAAIDAAKGASNDPGNS